MRVLGLMFVLVLTLALSGCGATGKSGVRLAGARATDSATSADCAHVVLQALTQVASRIYGQAGEGRTIAAARSRIEHSQALRDAVEQGDRAGVQRVLPGLIKGQIVRVHIRHGKHTLASYGTRSALAPASGQLRNAAGRAVGRYELAVQGQEGFRKTIAGLTDTTVRVQAVSGSGGGAGKTAKVDNGGLTRSFRARAFPAGRLRVSLQLKGAPPVAMCGVTTAQTSANAIGVVGERIYAAERSGPRVVAVARHVASFAPLVQAVAAGNALATRAAIDALFGAHLHIVRVRATRGDQLVADVGGADVLAPVSVPLRDPAGHTFGAAQISLQDDKGYIALAHRFTGAQVLLRSGARQVMGTLDPGPRGVPRSGPVLDGDTNYQAYSFTGEAFPAGALRISLLTPSE